MRLSLTLEEMENIILLLFFGNFGFIPILMPNTGGALTVHGQMEQTHAANHIVLLVVWSSIAWFLLRSRFRPRFNLFSTRVAFLYCAILTLPAIWAKDLQTVVSTFVSVTISTIYVLFLVGRFPAQRLVVMLGWTVLLLAVGSALFGVALPKYGLDHTGGDRAWQGVFEQKNGLGLVMTFGVAIALVLKPTSLLQRLWKASMFSLCLALAALSRSREAWVVCAVLLVVHVLLILHSLFERRSRGPVLVFCMILVLIFSGLVAANWTYLLNLIGRDATLSGRTQIWSAVIVECKRHLIFGHMGTGFWGTPAANVVYGQVGWMPTSAHNGFLETLLSLGIVGLLPICLLFFVAIRGALKLIASGQSYEAAKLWIYLILVITIFNLVQATIGATPNSISWLLLVGSACLLEQTVRNQKARVPTPIQVNRMTVASA